MNNGLLVLGAGLGVFLFSGIRVVRQQTHAIVETMGRYSTTLTPGLNWIIPVIQSTVATLDLRISGLEAKVEVKTGDDAFVVLPVTLMVQVIESRSADANYKLQNPISQIRDWGLKAVRAAASQMTLAELYQDRQSLQTDVEKDLAERLRSYGFQLVDVVVDQPTVDEAMQKSYNRVIASKRELEAATNEAEAKRVRTLGEARAESESQVLRAKGLSEAREILANGLAKAVKAAHDEGVDEKSVLELLVETNRLETIKYASEHGKLVLLDTRTPDAIKPVMSV